MFVCVARVTLEIPASGSLKAKRQVLRRVTDRVKAKFNAAVAEVEDNDLWQRATLAMAVVGNERPHVNEQMDKILHFIEEMYVAPIVSRQMEILAFGDELFGDGDDDEPSSLRMPSGMRSLAEAEGMGTWERRHAPEEPERAGKEGRAKGGKGPITLDEARAKARSLRNRREWEKK